TGNTIAVITPLGNQVRPIAKDEITHARPVALAEKPCVLTAPRHLMPLFRNCENLSLIWSVTGIAAESRPKRYAQKGFAPALSGETLTGLYNSVIETVMLP